MGGAVVEFWMRVSVCFWKLLGNCSCVYRLMVFE